MTRFETLIQISKLVMFAIAGLIAFNKINTIIHLLQK